ncbi:MAG: hypothetical protein BGN86_11925 [Caulobacterales bacterium 68-7]|nr:MAG: hypothetical protein BGN86_11925 [Caulobacterales bacterium 68-7]
MLKALNRAEAYRALAEAALAAAADMPLERAKALQQTAAAKWIELAEREERRAEASRLVAEPR